MTANTVAQTNRVREAIGGKAEMINLSGSDAPLRFTGTVVPASVAEQHPKHYAATAKIQLISSFIPAVLTGNANVPIDYGNGCGMSLMNYRSKAWDSALLAATSDGLTGGKETLQSKLPALARPDSIVGTVAAYYVEKYGFAEHCAVIAGSGDNPQAKVPIAGDLLSLGTSFVNMVSTDGDTLDPEGFANAMYDGINPSFHVRVSDERCYGLGCSEKPLRLIKRRIRTRRGSIKAGRTGAVHDVFGSRKLNPFRSLVHLT